MFEDYHTYGIWVHGCVQQLGYDSTYSNLNFNMIIATAIIGMYATCDFFRYVREVGTQTSRRNLVAFHSMIGAYNQYGRVEEALCFLCYADCQNFCMGNIIFFQYGMDIIIGTGLVEIQN